MATSTLRINCKSEGPQSGWDELGGGIGEPLYWTRGDTLALEIALSTNGTYLLDSDVTKVEVRLYKAQETGAWESLPLHYSSFLTADCNASYTGAAQWAAGTDELLNVSWSGVPDTGSYRLVVEDAGTIYLAQSIDCRQEASPVLRTDLVKSYLSELQELDIDTFAELDAIVADKSLVNLEDGVGGVGSEAANIYLDSTGTGIWFGNGAPPEINLLYNSAHLELQRVGAGDVGLRLNSGTGVLALETNGLFTIRNTGDTDYASIECEDIVIHGQVISSSPLNLASTADGDISLLPNGTGNIVLGTCTLDADQVLGAGTDNYVLTLDNAGNASFEAAAGGGISNIVEDVTPQLGADLDGQAFNITTTGIGTFDNIDVINNGTLEVYSDLDGATDYERVRHYMDTNGYGYIRHEKGGTGSGDILYVTGGGNSAAGLNLQHTFGTNGVSIGAAAVSVYKRLDPHLDGVSSLGVTSRRWSNTHTDALDINGIDITSDGTALDIQALHHRNADMAVTTASASDAITATTYLNVLANATIADGGLTHSEFTVDNTNKRITYTGTPTRTVKVSCAFSMTSSKSNEVSRYRLAKNGTTDSDTQVDRKIGTGSDVGAAAIQGTFSLATNDYIELWGTLDASTSDTITVQTCNMSIITL